MKISVICPTYNSAKYIDKALSSVIQQSRLPDELIIVDDGSEDNTLEILNKYKALNKDLFNIIVICNSHQGPGAARNKGILSSTANWIAFLDSDDYWEVNKLLEVEKKINSSSNINILCHNETFHKKSGKKKIMRYGRKIRKDIPFFKQLYFANIFSTSAVVCKRELLIEGGLFDENLKSAQDYELWLRLAPMMKPSFLDLELGHYIEREGNITSGSLIKRLNNELYIAMKYIDYVSKREFLFRLLRILMSYLKQLIGRLLRL